MKRPARLVAVSNRVGPVRGAAAAGGLAVGLVEALHERGGLWFGWSGRTAAAGRVRLRTEKVDGMTLATLDLTQHELDGYYNGFSNNCLWPLLHFRIDLTRFERSQLETEQRALVESIAAPGFYKESAVAIASALGRVEAIERELTTLYARWDALDSRK